MKKLLRILFACQVFLLPSILITAQHLQPFEGCPGVSVAVTRPGFNSNLLPHQIYLVTDSTGAMQAIGDPINLQINGFGLNNTDGFLYGMQQAFNVANPFLTRVDKNGDYQNVGRILPPAVSQFKVGIINTAAGTIDDKDNYYFTALVINLQNILLPPDIYVGKIEKISRLDEDNDPLHVSYKKISPGSCADELLGALLNPLTGSFQDIAYNHGDGYIYTYLPGAGPAPSAGKIAKFNPHVNSPVLHCIDPPAANIPTMDLSGLYFGIETTLYILTIDGKYYEGDISTGAIGLVTQTTLPLLNNNLRGDMASCVGKRRLHPFDDCPELSLAITRPGINSTMGPHQIYKINRNTGAIRSLGLPINLQINAFGLNNKDGFLYGMHETSNVFTPFLARVDSNGNYADLGIIRTPNTTGSRVGIINTAAATMDGRDNYYFTAIVRDTVNVLEIPALYLGTIKDVSKIKEGDSIYVRYERIFLGSCLDEILQSLSNPGNGLFQDIAFNPRDERIYTYIQPGVSPSPGKLASFRPGGMQRLRCIDPPQPNIPTQDLSGMFAGENGRLYILTIDGKFYRANFNTGVVSLVSQTTLPLLGNNLRGDMASCVRKQDDHDHDHDCDHHHDRLANDNSTGEDQQKLRVAPNPVNGNDLLLLVNDAEQGVADMRILDVNGNVMQSQKLVMSKNQGQYKVQVSKLYPGMYSVVVVYASGKREAVKFVRIK